MDNLGTIFYHNIDVLYCCSLQVILLYTSVIQYYIIIMKQCPVRVFASTTVKFTKHSENYFEETITVQSKSDHRR